MLEVIAVLVSAVAAAGVAALVFLWQQTRESALRRRHCAAMLYYDLKSMESYVEGFRSLKNDLRNQVGVRFNERWQEQLAACEFLDQKQVGYLYQIYDAVHNYNHYLLHGIDLDVIKDFFEQVELRFYLAKDNRDLTPRLKDLYTMLKKIGRIEED